MLSLENTLKLSAIADKMDIEMPDIKDKTVEEIGKEFLKQFVRKAYLASDEIFQFVAEYKKISVEEAKAIDIMQVVEILKSEKGIMSFFK